MSATATRPITGTAPAHDGSQTRFTVTGTGPPLFISPLRREGRIADGYLERLADAYRVVLMDYPGIAKPETLTPDNAVGDMLAVADEAGIDRFVWWGYSFGSVLGLQVAARSDRVAAFVCGGWTPMGAMYSSLLELSSRMARLVRPLGRRGAATRQWVTFYAALQGWDETEALRALAGKPRLVFVGSKDDTKSSRLASLVAQHHDALTADGWDVDIVEGQRHHMVIKPGVVVPPVRAWLDAHRAEIERRIGAS